MNKEELKENIIYKKLIKQSSKKGMFCPFRKEFQMEVIEKFLIKDIRNKSKLNIFEACSGQGRLLYYLNKFNNKPNYFGIDYVKENVDYANKLFKNNKNIQCELGNVYKLSRKYLKKFDITFLYKTLNYIPNYKTVLRNLYNVTRNKIYITAFFYEGDIDFETKINNYSLYKKGEYVTYYTLGKPRFCKFCKKIGAKKITFYDMKLPLDLPKPKDPNVLQTYTIKDAKGENIELTGIIKLDWKLVIIEL